MPNKKAKARKQKRKELDKRWTTEGRTAKQHKKWLTKQKEKGIFAKKGMIYFPKVLLTLCCDFWN